MNTISIRNNYDSRFFFGKLSIKTEEGMFTGAPALDYLIVLCSNKRVLFLIHGYNSSAESAEKSYEIIEQKLKEHGLLGPDSVYQVCVGILWPGRTAPGYSLAEMAAGSAAKKLAPILAELECEELSIETHSLGAKVALDMIKRDECPKIFSLVLTAAAVDGESIQKGEKYEKSIDKCVKVLNCFSPKDEVLHGAYRWFGSLFRNIFSLGDTALGDKGVDDLSKVDSKVEQLDGTDFVDGHSDWRFADQLYIKWREWC